MSASRRLEWGATQVTIGRFVLEVADREYWIGGQSTDPRFVRCRLSLGDSVRGNGYGMTAAEAGANLEARNGGNVVLDDDERAALAAADARRAP